MKLKRRAFTLLEVSIALFLAAILISVLLKFTFEAHLLEKNLEIVKKEVLQRHQFQTRLNQVLLEIPKASFCFPETAPLFTKKYPKEKYLSLTFLFDNGIDPSPDFSGPLFGRLHLENGELSLLIWPFDKQQKSIYRKEVLMNNVRNIEYEFFTFEDTSFTWTPSWSPEKKELPPMVRIKIHQEKEYLFAFILPVSTPEIIYRKTP